MPDTLGTLVEQVSILESWVGWMIPGLIGPLVLWLDNKTTLIGEIMRPNIAVAILTALAVYGLHFWLEPGMSTQEILEMALKLTGVNAIVYSGSMAAKKMKGDHSA